MNQSARRAKRLKFGVWVGLVFLLTSANASRGAPLSIPNYPVLTMVETITVFRHLDLICKLEKAPCRSSRIQRDLDTVHGSRLVLMRFVNQNQNFEWYRSRLLNRFRRLALHLMDCLESTTDSYPALGPPPYLESPHDPMVIEERLISQSGNVVVSEARRRPRPVSLESVVPPIAARVLVATAYSSVSTFRNFGSDCAICLEALGENGGIACLPSCGHTFCAECIERTILDAARTRRGRAVCPYCRQAIFLPLTLISTKVRRLQLLDDLHEPSETTLASQQND